MTACGVVYDGDENAPNDAAGNAALNAGSAQCDADAAGNNYLDLYDNNLNNKKDLNETFAQFKTNVFKQKESVYKKNISKYVDVVIAERPAQYGVIYYTIGQRKGLGLALGYPAFVIEIRPETNEVVIGTNEDSMSNYVRANQLNFMSIEDLTEPMRVFAKIRYNHKGAWCTIEKTGADELLCTFEEQQRAITPGQAVVFYDGDYVLGGGTIIGDK